MNVLDAMAARRSVQSFDLRQPERSTVEGVLRNAGQAPSGGDIQPWRVHAFTGEALADVVNIAAAAADRIIASHAEPNHFGVDDAGAMAAARRAGLRFFEAPVGLLFTIPSAAGEAEWLEHGALVMSVCLAAMEYDLGTCIIRDFRLLQHELAEALKLDVRNERVTLGVALGYEGRRRASRGRFNDINGFVEFSWS